MIFRKNIIKLNDNQKQFLVDKGYITTKTLDSLDYEGWEQYYIKHFDWRLSIKQNEYNMYNLILASLKTEDVYEPMLNFQNNDLEELLEIK